MALLSGGVHDGDLVRVDVAADGSGSSSRAPGCARRAIGCRGIHRADDDVIEAELLDD
jgi:ATP-dependent Clp protease ATP-binding subunit ClpB